MSTLAWSDLTLVSDNLVAYFFGTQIALAMAVLFFFLLLLVGGGLEFKYSVMLLLPLLAAYAVGGILGANVWVLHVGIIIAGILYSSAILKMVG